MRCRISPPNTSSRAARHHRPPREGSSQQHLEFSILRIALTFDTEHNDRPATNPRGVDDVLDALVEIEATATFFVQGRWAEAHPGAVRRIAREGHLIGSHSFFHCWTPLLTDDGIASDLDRARAAIVAAAAVDPHPWFRLPFFGGYDDERVKEVVTAKGYRHCGLTVAPADYEPDATPESLLADVMQGLPGHEPAVVVMHSWPRHTADVVRALAGAGEFVRYDELSDAERAAIPLSFEPTAALAADTDADAGG